MWQTKTITAADGRLRIRVVTDDDGRFNIDVFASAIGTRLTLDEPYNGGQDTSFVVSGKVVDR